MFLFRPIARPFKIKEYLPGLCLIFILIFLARPAQGQVSPITASVNSDNVSTDELVTLTVTVVDDSAQQPRPILPRLNGLAVIDLDIATNMDIVSGKIHTEVTYTYLLQPRRTGLLTIPPVTVKIDDKTYKAAPISIRVSQGNAPVPSPDNVFVPDNVSPPANLKGQDFFVEARVDLLTPYIGQQIIYTFQFYQALSVYREPQYEGPLFIGFETMGLPVREYNLDVGGRTYLITEIRTALFPDRVGRITIDSSRLTLPGNIYEEPIELYTDPIQVEVRRLPDPAPADFTGAVGQYKIEAMFSPQVAVINQPSTLYVTVSGIGNIGTLPELIWPELEGWQAYNSLTSLTTAMEEDIMTGTRVYERVMVPGQVGEFIIPAISLVYFDPIAAEYRTVETEILSVKVIPAPTPDPAAPVAAATATPVIAARSGDIETPASRVGFLAWLDLWNLGRNLTSPLTLILLLGLCGAVPAALFLGVSGSWLWQQRRQRVPEKSVEAVATGPEEILQQPRQSIHPILAAAMQKNDDNYKAVGQALNTYLGEMLQTSVNGLTRTELAARLGEYGLDQALIARIEASLAQSELGRYGPLPHDDGWTLMVTADALLFELDKAIDPGGLS